MSEQDWLAERFEEHRPQLRAAAYRMLRSTGEAEDAVQEAWLRLSRTGPDGIDNLGGWLTTVVARICLNQLRARTVRREAWPPRVPDPVVGAPDGGDPAQEAVLADSVGLALLVVLETLTPAERLAFVLHDVFSLPYEEIAPIVDRSPVAARQLASRARRRVQDGAPRPTADRARQRAVVDAFFAAARQGDFAALVAVLHPDVVLRSDGGDADPGASALVRGPEQVAGRALRFAGLAPHLRPALVNGGAGVVVAPGGRAVAVMAFTVVDGLVVAIDALTDPVRLAALDLSALD